MKVFVTGASGHLGSAVVPELIGAGHTVLGLARSQASADAVSAYGAEVLRGSLEDLAALRDGASRCDGVIHLAYRHDAPGQAVAADQAAIAAIGDALDGTSKRFLGTSGTLLLEQGQVGIEDDAPDPRSPAAQRLEAEILAVGLAQRGVRAAVVRLPPTVHSDLDHNGFVPTLIGIARDRGVSGYVGDGQNRWPAVHTRDAARVFRLALETSTSSPRYHAVADDGIAFRDIASAIGEQLGIPVVSVPQAEAADHFGWLNFAVEADNPTSAQLTRAELGWTPAHPGLLDDLRQAHYFSA